MSEEPNNKEESNNEVQKGVKIISVSENEDGSSDMEIDVDDEFLHRYLQITGRTEIVEEEVAEWILGGMKKQLGEIAANKEEEPPASQENAK